MKKYLIIVLAVIITYGAINWLFPFSPLLFNPQITYHSPEQDVEEYIKIHETLENIQSTFTNKYPEIQRISYGINQQWAMEKEPVNIKLKDLIIIELYLQQSKDYLNNLKKDRLEITPLIAIENNINEILQAIKKITDSQWASRFYIEDTISNIRNSSFRALTNLEEFLLISNEKSVSNGSTEVLSYEDFNLITKEIIDNALKKTYENAEVLPILVTVYPGNPNNVWTIDTLDVVENDALKPKKVSVLINRNKLITKVDFVFNPSIKDKQYYSVNRIEPTMVSEQDVKVFPNIYIENFTTKGIFIQTTTFAETTIESNAFLSDEMIKRAVEVVTLIQHYLVENNL